MLTLICRRIICLAVCSLVAVSVCAQTPPQSEKSLPETIRVKTELVVLDAQAVDKKSRETIRGLTGQDFELLEDGVKQQIEYFSQDKLPLSIILLLDISPSVKPVIEKIREGALQALQRLKPEDEVALMIFSGWTELIQDFTKDRQLILNKLGPALEKTSGGTRIHEAIAKAARQMRYATNPTSRRVIIAITDNQGSMSRRYDPISEEEVRQAVIESGATVCGLIVRSLLNVVSGVVFQHPAVQEVYKRTSVNPYVEQTGGEITGASKDEVNARLGEMIEHLRIRYSLGYLPTNQNFDGKFRRIKLALSRDARRRLGGEITINTKQGYYAVDRESEDLLAEEQSEPAKNESHEPQPGITSPPSASQTEKAAATGATPERVAPPPETKASDSIAAQPSVAEPPRTAKPPDAATNPYAHLVMLDVQAMNKKTGAVAGNLTKEDFELEDNGVRQEIAHFSRGQLPLSIVLLIDVAGNTPYVMSSLRRGVAQWLRQLKPDDEVSLMAFGLQAAVIQDFTKDRKLIASKLRNLVETARQLNLGAWQDRTMAVFQAAEQMDKAANPVGRRAIITITDDSSRSATGAKPDYTAELLFDSGSVVYGMVTKGYRPSRKRQITSAAAHAAIFSLGNPFAIVTQIATKMATETLINAILKDRHFGQMIQKTGGAVIRAEGEDATSKLAMLIDQVRNRYVVGFTPSTATTGERFHKLRLKLKPEAQKRAGEISVITAQGYYARKPEEGDAVEASNAVGKNSTKNPD